MGLPTHRNSVVRGILRRRWAKAHKNWTGGYPTKTEAQALANSDAAYRVGGGDSSTHGAHGTVDIAIDAAADDRIARSLGVTDSDSLSGIDSTGSKGT